MHINSLPSLVFGIIFSRLPLYDLLQAGRVCALWSVYQLDITRKLHSITLLIGVKTIHNAVIERTRVSYYREPADLIAHSSFTLRHSNELLNIDQGGPLFATQSITNVGTSGTLTSPNLNMSTVAQLVTSLPNVHTLNISINGIPCSNVTENVIYLLNQWKDKLVTLRMWFKFCNLQTDEWLNLVPKLFKTLNLLYALEHLTLNLFSASTFSPEDSDSDSEVNLNLGLDFSILSRLREFNYECEYAFDDVEEWIARSGTSAQLQRIGINGQNNGIGDIASSPFAGQITFLPIYFFSTIQDAATNLSVFTSLTSFDVYFPFSPNSQNQSFLDLFKSISALKQLIHLNLHLIRNSMADFNSIPTRKFVQLRSVKLLCLGVTSFKHTDLESPHWAWIFPNVQILSVQHSCIRKFPNRTIRKCPNLDHFDASSPVPLSAVIDGVRDLLATFKQCPSLRRIYLNDQLRKYQDPHVVAKFNFNL